MVNISRRISFNESRQWEMLLSLSLQGIGTKLKYILSDVCLRKFSGWDPNGLHFILVFQWVPWNHSLTWHDSLCFHFLLSPFLTWKPPCLPHIYTLPRSINGLDGYLIHYSSKFSSKHLSLNFSSDWNYNVLPQHTTMFVRTMNL